MTEKSSPQPVAATHDYTPHGEWEARCRDVTYKGGDWPRDQFLQWEVYGPDEPQGRGEFHREQALLVAAAPELLKAARLYLAWCEAEDDHSKADFHQRLQMCRDAETATRAAIAKATGAQA